MEGSSQQSNKNDTSSEVLLDEELKNATQAITDLHLSEKETEKVSQLTMPPNYLEMQCPFTWEIFKTSDGTVYEKVFREKLERAECIDFSTFCYTLILGCYCEVQNKKEEALEKFGHCEELLKRRSSEPFFKEIIPGMKHLIDASKCHFYFKTNQPLLAAHISSSIQPFEDLSNESKGCVFACKSFKLSNFGYEGKLEAYECIKRAIALDPDEDGSRKGLWYYRAGKLLDETRRDYSGEEIYSKEELKYLERSVLHDPYPIQYAVLADAYRESSKNVRKKRIYPKACMLSEQSLKSYKKALECDSTSISVLNRCATGLTKLPKIYRDVQLAEDCLKKVLNMKPDNAQAHMSLGNIEDWHKNNPKAALKCFEKSFEYGNNSAVFKIIRVKYKMDKFYDPLNDCDKYISVLHERKIREYNVNRFIATLYGLKGEYYLRIKNDLVAAAKEWEKAFDILPNSRTVLEHLCCFSSLEPQPPWNLYEILEKEITNALASSRLGETDRKYLKELLRKTLEERENDTV